MIEVAAVQVRHAPEPRRETPAARPGLLFQLAGGEVRIARIPALIDERCAVPHLALERARTVAIGIPDQAGGPVERAHPDPAAQRVVAILLVLRVENVPV